MFPINTESPSHFSAKLCFQPIDVHFLFITPYQMKQFQIRLHGVAWNRNKIAAEVGRHSTEQL
jgi:hypothetical protein